VTPRTPTVLTVAGLSHVGVARSHNEDCFRVSRIGSPLDLGPEAAVERIVWEGGLVLGVYDGVGGKDAGDHASTTAARTVADAFTAGGLPRGPVDLSARLVDAVTAAGQAIAAESRANKNRRGMGSTATVAAISDGHLVVAQVGDSRGYVLRSRELVQVTRDDTLLQEALRTGSLAPEDAAQFPHKNVLLQVLGNGAKLKVGVSSIEPRLGDVLLLCTDGIHGLLEDALLRATLLRHHDPGVAARVLVDEALRAGGSDNIAVVVARLEGEKLAPPQPGDHLEEKIVFETG
jgi:protein phosphatase